MFSPTLASAILFGTTLVSAAANFSFSTPQSLAQCSPTTLNWIGGRPPYTVMVYPSCTDDTFDDGSDAPLDKFTVDNGTFITWTVNVAAQRMVQLVMTDADGNNAYSDDVMVGSYNNSASCLNQPLQIAYSAISNSSASDPTQTHTPAANSTILPLGNAQNAGLSISIPSGAVAFSLATVLLSFAAVF